MRPCQKMVFFPVPFCLTSHVPFERCDMPGDERATDTRISNFNDAVLCGLYFSHSNGDLTDMASVSMAFRGFRVQDADRCQRAGDSCFNLHHDRFHFRKVSTVSL